jgi:hypothetical protein
MNNDNNEIYPPGGFLQHQQQQPRPNNNNNNNEVGEEQNPMIPLPHVINNNALVIERVGRNDNNNNTHRHQNHPVGDEIIPVPQQHVIIHQHQNQNQPQPQQEQRRNPQQPRLPAPENHHHFPIGIHRLLLRNQVRDLNANNNNPTTAAQKALWQAVTIGEIEAVEVLLESKSDDLDINRVDSQGDQRQGCTALHLAILEMPTWRGTEGRNGIQTHEFVKRFFLLLLQYGADIDRVCTYAGEWYLQTAAGKTKSFFPNGNSALGLVLQFIECTRGSAVVSLNVCKRLDLIRDIFLDHLRSRNGIFNGNLFWSNNYSSSSSGAGAGTGGDVMTNVDSPSKSSSLSSHIMRSTSLYRSPLLIGAGGAGGDENNTIGLLARDLTIAYQNNVLCDVIIRCQGVRFNAHRFILAARSPVFAAMLNNEGIFSFAESQTGQIEINNTQPRALHIFLHFLYTDRWVDDFDQTHNTTTITTTTSSSSSSNSNTKNQNEDVVSIVVLDDEQQQQPKSTPSDMTTTTTTSSTLPSVDRIENEFIVVSEVLRLSNQYQVPVLKLVCSERLSVNLAIENAASILKIADDNEATNLRNFTLDYISKNAERVINTDAFKLLNQNLAMEVLTTCVMSRPGANNSGRVRLGMNSSGGTNNNNMTDNSTSTPSAKRRKEGG